MVELVSEWLAVLYVVGSVLAGFVQLRRECGAGPYLNPIQCAGLLIFWPVALSLGWFSRRRKDNRSS